MKKKSRSGFLTQIGTDRSALAGRAKARQKGTDTMKAMKKLNLKTMIETYKNAGSAEEADRIWTTFRQMYYLDFISWDTWSKFFDACHAIEFEL